MTTVAANTGCMAADTQLTGDYTYRVQKIFRLPDGSIVGGSGTWSQAYRAIAWMLGGRVGDAPSLKEAALLILRPDGSLWMAEQSFPEFPLLDTFAAIGCGAQSAQLAMVHGASPAEAVKQVSRIESNTSEPVQMLSLDPKRKRTRP